MTRPSVVLVATRPLGRLSQAPSAYDEAARAAALALAAGRYGVVTLDELAPLRVVDAFRSLDAHRVINPAIDRLLALPPNHLRQALETLHALWEGRGRVSDAAELLHLRERAMRTRITKLRERTGLDVNDPRQRWQLELARHALAVFGEAPVAAKSSGARRAGRRRRAPASPPSRHRGRGA